jgi:hypothetical protein
MNDALSKLSSVRHYCFIRGVLGKFPGGEIDPEHRNGSTGDFLIAFRTLNRLFVDLKGQSESRRPPATRRRNAA